MQATTCIRIKELEEKQVEIDKLEKELNGLRVGQMFDSIFGGFKKGATHENHD
jgi:hypothetical protein